MNLVYSTPEKLIVRRRITSPMLQQVPAVVKEFDAYLYAVVPRAAGREMAGKYGGDVRIDPCVLDWRNKCLVLQIPFDVNPGVSGVEDLDPDFFEALQAAFLAFMNACV